VTNENTNKRAIVFFPFIMTKFYALYEKTRGLDAEVVMCGHQLGIPYYLFAVFTMATWALVMCGLCKFIFGDSAFAC
jgi:hypothetical protein